MRGLALCFWIAILGAAALTGCGRLRRGFVVILQYRGRNVPSLVDTLPELEKDSLPLAVQQALTDRMRAPTVPADVRCNRYFGRDTGPFVVSTEAMCEDSVLMNGSFFYAFAATGEEILPILRSGPLRKPLFNAAGLTGEPTQMCPPMRTHKGRPDPNIISACPDWTMR